MTGVLEPESEGSITAISSHGQPYYYKLGRLVVLKEYRQCRFGRALVLALHDWAQREPAGVTDAVDVAQDPDQATYNHAGVPVRSDRGDGLIPSSNLKATHVRIVAHSQLPAVNFYSKCVHQLFLHYSLSAKFRFWCMIVGARYFYYFDLRFSPSAARAFCLQRTGSGDFYQPGPDACLTRDQRKSYSHHTSF